MVQPATSNLHSTSTLWQHRETTGRERNTTHLFQNRGGILRVEENNTHTANQSAHGTDRNSDHRCSRASIHCNRAAAKTERGHNQLPSELSVTSQPHGIPESSAPNDGQHTPVIFISRLCSRPTNKLKNHLRFQAKNMVTPVKHLFNDQRGIPTWGHFKLQIKNTFISIISTQSTTRCSS